MLGRHEQAAAWLTVWTDLGRAPRTIDAYGRGLAEYLLMSERESVDPVTANRAHIAVYVRELSSRPHRRGANVISIDSGAGLANATIQQRLVPVRLFYDFLVTPPPRERGGFSLSGLSFATDQPGPQNVECTHRVRVRAVAARNAVEPLLGGPVLR